MLKYPLHIEIKLTNKCNLKCLHCIALAGKETQDELSTKEIFSIIDDAKKNGAFTIGLTGGEPFLRKNIFEIIDKVYSCGLHLIITTNGTLLTKDIVERIKDKVSLFRISLDNNIEERHDYFRGTKGSFVKAINAIKLLLKYEKFFQLTTLTVISNYNINKITEIIDFFEDLGIKSSNIFLFVPGGRGANRRNDFCLSRDQIKNFCETIKNEKLNRSKISIHTSNPLMSIIESDENSSRCPAAFTSCFIVENGNVLPCPYFYKYNYPDDNIRNNKLIDIWKQSDRFNSLRDDTKLNFKCKKCSHKNACFGGCRAGAYMEYNSIDGPDPMCWI